MNGNYSLADARTSNQNLNHTDLKGTAHRLSLKGKGKKSQRTTGSYLIIRDDQKNDEIMVVRIDKDDGKTPLILKEEDVQVICPLVPDPKYHPGLKGAKQLLSQQQ